jgi:capsular polysaccharide biosynthesis protein
MPMSKRRAQRRETRISLLISGLVALLIVIAGGVAALAQKTVYTAESVTVVLPSAGLDTAGSAAYYETLSRGQIVATFAEVANNPRFEQQAEDKLRLTDAQRATVTTSVSVVPDTSVILVRASAEDATIAEQIADGTTSTATEYLGSLSKPYRTDLVRSAQGSAYRSSTSPVLLFGLAVVVALIAALAIQQAIYHLLIAVRRGPNRGAAAFGAPADLAITGNGGGPLAEKHESTSR